MVWFNNTLKNDPIRCKKLASDGVIFQSVIKPFFKTPVFGAPSTSLQNLEFLLEFLFEFC